MILARTAAGVTGTGQPPLESKMADFSPTHRLPSDIPDGSADLAVRVRYLRRSRRLALGRVWLTLWIVVIAVVAWLFIAGFAGFNH